MRPSPSSSDRSREPRGSPAAGPEPLGWLGALARGLVAMTVIVRLLTPTDGAVTGETIWVAQLALLALVVWGIALFRSGAIRLEFDWIDGAVGLLMAGQIVGALCVVATSGDKRAALTMLWEWCGLGATFFLARRLLSAPAERRSLLLAVAATAVSLSALGLWQHYFGYADSRREYETLKAQYQALVERGRPAEAAEASDWDRALQRVQAEFMRMNIPSDLGARMMWEQRLNSSEPFGMFALANTLAGYLAFSAVIWLALLAESWRAVARWQSLLGALASLLIFYCLLLTKSRTAFVGLVMGLAAALARFRGRKAGLNSGEFSDRRRWLRTIAAGAGGVALLIGLAAATGGLDRFVVSESMKSLRYRFEYWQGTFRMLTDDLQSALLGVGPGNFRQHYLAYKLPRSSEEIADPHNLFFDVWANGGVLSLIGLVGVCIAGCRPLWRGGQTESIGTGTAEKHGESPLAYAVLAGGALAYPVVFVPGGPTAETIVLLLLGWLCVAAVCRGLFSRDLSPAAWVGAFLALGIHLLGAGGIAMPAIAQLLVLAAALGSLGNRSRVWAINSDSRLAGAFIALSVLGIYFACWFTGLSPIVGARAALAAGKQELYEEHQAKVAERQFHLAATADPHASEPYELLAQVAFQQWLARDDADSKEFDRAVAWQGEAIARDPRLAAPHRVLGEMHLAKFTRTGDLAEASAAADAFGRAVELYPNFAPGQAELAEAFFKGGLVEPARVAAARALELDRINDEAGHIDKRLRPDRRDLMEEIQRMTNEE